MIIKEHLYESFEDKAKKALSQTKQDPELSIYHYFEDRGSMNMLRALRSTLKRLLTGMDFDKAFEESCDINGVLDPNDKEELMDVMVSMFDLPSEKFPF